MFCAFGIYDTYHSHISQLHISHHFCLSHKPGSHISHYMDNPGGKLQKTLARIGIDALLDMVGIYVTKPVLMLCYSPTLCTLFIDTHSLHSLPVSFPLSLSPFLSPLLSPSLPLPLSVFPSLTLSFSPFLLSLSIYSAVHSQLCPW